jgi:hypothetical protein
MPPLAVWVSDVQIRALVVRTTASSGPGSGMGLSMKPICPIFLITNVFTLAHVHCLNTASTVLNYPRAMAGPLGTLNRIKIS